MSRVKEDKFSRVILPILFYFHLYAFFHINSLSALVFISTFYQYLVSYSLKSVSHVIHLS